MRPFVPIATLAWLVLALSPPAASAHDELTPRREALAAATANNPGDPALWLARAELARVARDFDAAATALERAAALAPGALAVARCRIALALDRGRLGEARAILDPALAAAGHSPDDVAALEAFAARIASAEGRTADALAHCDRALAAAPRPTAEMELTRAGLARELHGPAESARGLARARARLPHDGALLDALARDLAALGRDDEAKALLAGWPADKAPPATRPSTAAPPPGRVLASTLVPRGAAWRWSAAGSEPPGWKTPSPGDTSWPAGPAPLGFGDAFIATTIPAGPDAGTRYTTSYFRSEFAVTDPVGTFASLTLSANYDDGFVAWLNGVEIARRGLAPGPIAYATFAASHEGGAYEPVDVTAALSLIVQGTNILAVEVHQTSSTSSDLAWDGELVAAATPATASVVRGPWLQNAAHDAITVRWRTDVATDSRLWLGATTGRLVPAADDPALVTEHEVRVGGLSPETAYAYAVGSIGGMLAGGDTTFVFRTSPRPGDVASTRVWILGDSGLPGAAQDRVRDAYAAWPGAAATNVWLMLGDNAYQTGTDAEYGAGLFAPYASFLRRNVLWPTRGNHDAIHSGGANDYYDLFTLPTTGEAGGMASSTEAWYSFDHGDVHFVCLDSEGSLRTPGSPMLTWLAADLAATQRMWTIVFFHHPPYTKGSHDSDNVSDSGGRMRDMRENVMPILEAAGVDLILAGHSHSYERSYLLDGHYGTSATLTPAMILDAGDGDPRVGGDGVYGKATPGKAPHEGEVVAVAGSSAQVSGGTLDHPAMVRSLNVLGSLVLDIAGTRLDAVFLDDLGAVRDRFTIEKQATVSADDPGDRGTAATPTLRVAGANPFRGTTRLAIDLPRAGDAKLRVVDAAGRRVRRLATGARGAGRHDIAWDGNDESGRRAPAGLYFAILDAAGERRVARLLRID